MIESFSRTGSNVEDADPVLRKTRGAGLLTCAAAHEKRGKSIIETQSPGAVRR